MSGYYALAMALLQALSETNWVGCSLVEVLPGKVSGVPLLRGTRVQADAIVENYKGGSPVSEISENFAVPETVIQNLLTFAEEQQRTNP